MRIIDLNVLLYAVNSDAAQHDRLRGWWEQAVNDEDTIGLVDTCHSSAGPAPRATSRPTRISRRSP